METQDQGLHYETHQGQPHLPDHPGIGNNPKCFEHFVPRGFLYKGGGKIFAVLKVDNPKKEPLYKIKGKQQDIYVTGEHYVFDKTNKKWIQVKDYKNAEIQEDFIPEYFSCLITTNRRIKIGDELFWDWEDDDTTCSE